MSQGGEVRNPRRLRSETEMPFFLRRGLPTGAASAGVSLVPAGVRGRGFRSFPSHRHPTPNQWAVWKWRPVGKGEDASSRSPCPERVREPQPGLSPKWIGDGTAAPVLFGKTILCTRCRLHLQQCLETYLSAASPPIHLAGQRDVTTRGIYQTLYTKGLPFGDSHRTHRSLPFLFCMDNYT